MSWESERVHEESDKAKLVWGGIVLLLVLMGLEVPSEMRGKSLLLPRG